MKNVHVLATDKPSRLIINWEKDLCYKSKPYLMEGTQNIYITSDVEIKEGDWYFDGTDLIHKKTKYNDALVDGNKNAKKIILTTDFKLIKDCVQAIDDEFLEWFVQNPSCEEVEVELKTKQLVKPYDVYNESVSYYKIIIPKEEPKQETLEEIAVRLVKETTLYGSQEAVIGSSARSYFETELRCLLMGMKWQQQQNSYSDEDMQLMFEFGYRKNNFTESTFKDALNYIKQKNK